ncbi:hypothetical protein [Pedobacter heparinus]|uniref:hypothetical protein n=1 Tax=Pedobacter heparinus TaxID=984 RepID=UPI0002D7F352|nr:hypothetical protein [Pedobacter heparinus]
MPSASVMVLVNLKIFYGYIAVRQLNDTGILNVLRQSHRVWLTLVWLEILHIVGPEACIFAAALGIVYLVIIGQGNMHGRNF